MNLSRETSTALECQHLSLSNALRTERNNASAFEFRAEMADAEDVKADNLACAALWRNKAERTACELRNIEAELSMRKAQTL